MKDFLCKVGTIFIVGCIIYVVYSEGLQCAFKKFPVPEGQYAVGLEIHTMQYTNRSLWIWYPCNQSKYYPQRNEYGDRNQLKLFTEAIAKDQPWSVRLFARANQNINLWGSPSHAQRNTPLAKHRDQYPIIFFIPEGPVPPFLYSGISENLASHGFVVVGIHEPELCFGGDMVHVSGIIPHLQQPEDEAGWEKAVHASLKNCVEAVSYMESLNKSRSHQWYNRLTFDAYGCYGFAWNGMVPLFLCNKDPRCKAGAVINGWVDIKLPPELAAPLFIVHCSSEEELYIECVRTSLRKNNVLESSFPYLQGVSVYDSNYCSFSDTACFDTPLAHVYPKQEFPRAVLRSVGQKLTDFFKSNLCNDLNAIKARE